MARQDQANDQFSLTSFLYGGNADYIEELHAAYAGRSRSRSTPEWREFFDALKDDAGDVTQERRGRFLGEAELADRRPMANWSRRSTATGAWSKSIVEKKVKDKAAANGAALSDADVLQATRDSVRAIMMIRAYRMRGHLHANLDPLGIAKPIEDYNELSPETYGFTEADYDRPIFIDNVLGLEYATIRADARHPEAHLLLDARRRVHAHLRSRGEGLDPGAHRRAGQGHRLHRRTARRRSCRS